MIEHDSKTLKWNEMFLLGQSRMDATHRDFVEVVCRLQMAPDAELASALANVISHLVHHFQDEDSSMEQTNYPAMACHVAEHAAVLATGRNVVVALGKGDTALCRRYANELARWFPGHADYLDAPLAQWLSHKRFGGIPVVLKRGAAAQV